MTDQTEAIRIGIAGIGRAGWGMHCVELEGREDKFEIVAACDIDPARCERMKERYGCRTYQSIEDMIADPNVELVDVATRSSDHESHAIAALMENKHVFLEKPMALTYESAKRICDTADQSDGRLFIRHNRRFEPAFQHILEIIASGILGNVYEVKLRRHHYARRDDWQALTGCGGGQLLNWGPHIIDHGLRLLDAPLEKLWSDLKRVAAVGDAEDHLKIIMKGENARVIDLEISGGNALPESEYHIAGTRGALSCTGDEIHLRYLNPDQKLQEREANPQSPPMEGGFGSPEELTWVDERIPVAPSSPYTMDGIWDYLYDSLRHGRQFPISLQEALQVMQVITKAREGTPFQME
ncbi:MAG: Gfo/Idh/MocA family oxidoreductase [Candidatus Pacebacteria bacterium]|nr:Gfo/Idh/MocA family oxidoreductase [Candidatus Paceibacterota bacterium]